MLHRDGVHSAGRLACACLLLESVWVSGGMILIGLGDLPGGQVRSNAQAVSADGSVVVGYSSTASGDEAYRWTASDGMVGLGHLTGYANSYSDAVSADGSVVVGRGETPGSLACRWTAGSGMVSLGGLGAGAITMPLTFWPHPRLQTSK
jgi:probable HAF family extracellular repeat protein